MTADQFAAMVNDLEIVPYLRESCIDRMALSVVSPYDKGRFASCSEVRNIGRASETDVCRKRSYKEDGGEAVRKQSASQQFEESDTGGM